MTVIILYNHDEMVIFVEDRIHIIPANVESIGPVESQEIIKMWND